MNKLIKLSILLIVSGLFLSSCIKTKFDEPEKATYNPGLTATTTIQELIALYEGGLTYLDTAVIISGTVIANDKTGNFYKQMVIQDSTAGIAIDIDLYELHNLYHIGDLVYIKCEGLYLGQYGGVVKLGSIYEGEIGRIPEPQVKYHIFKSDGGVPIEPTPLALTSPNLSLVNKLVVLEDVQFSLGALGNTYADAVYQTDGEWNIENCDGNSMLVRTSGYCDFARDTLPSGNGRMIAVLGMYNGEYQLTIRDPRELSFTGDRCGAIFEETFEGSLGSFTPYSVTGDQVWTYSSQYGAVMSGYASGNHANEDWLISPSFDFSDYTGLVLNFRHAWNYSTANGTNDITVWISTNYNGVSNPNNATWTKLTVPNYPPGNNWSFVDSGDVIMSSAAGSSNVHFAFKYVSTNSDACTWELDNITISLQ